MDYVSETKSIIYRLLYKRTDAMGASTSRDGRGIFILIEAQMDKSSIDPRIKDRGSNPQVRTGCQR